MEWDRISQFAAASPPERRGTLMRPPGDPSLVLSTSSSWPTSVSCCVYCVACLVADKLAPWLFSLTRQTSVPGSVPIPSAVQSAPLPSVRALSAI